jgi:molybdopterin-guanine dinucleotide biosynthesis protein B
MPPQAPRPEPLPPIVSVVGKSNSGKTTLLEALIRCLKGRGYRVAVVKHHGHVTSFDQPGKDTYRHAQAGADVVVGASPVQLAVFLAEAGEASALEGIVRRFAAHVDLVFTEGYKRGPYPKIEVCRAARSQALICEPGELLAVASDLDFAIGVPCFGLDDGEALADFIEAEVLRRPQV